MEHLIDEPVIPFIQKGVGAILHCPLKQSTVIQKHKISDTSSKAPTLPEMEFLSGKLAGILLGFATGKKDTHRQDGWNK